MWQDTIEMVSEPTFKIGGKVRVGIEKFNVNPNISFDGTPLNISHIYFLRLSQKKNSDIQSIDKIQALFKLLEHTYAKGQMKGIGGQENQFSVFSHFLKNVKMKVVNRSSHEQNPEQLIRLIERDFIDNE